MQQQFSCYTPFYYPPPLCYSNANPMQMYPYSKMNGECSMGGCVRCTVAEIDSQMEDITNRLCLQRIRTITTTKKAVKMKRNNSR
mmetsp:Transcript_7632/g.11621  ORF Transcript_7632/g.11621 Transcript_7632/m.11621 type:complete len:85 (-) Transcript_7632:74-328(-)